MRRFAAVQFAPTGDSPRRSGTDRAAPALLEMVALAGGPISVSRAASASAPHKGSGWAVRGTAWHRGVHVGNNVGPMRPGHHRLCGPIGEPHSRCRPRSWHASVCARRIGYDHRKRRTLVWIHGCLSVRHHAGAHRGQAAVVSVGASHTGPQRQPCQVRLVGLKAK